MMAPPFAIVKAAPARRSGLVVVIGEGEIRQH